MLPSDLEEDMISNDRFSKLDKLSKQRGIVEWEKYGETYHIYYKFTNHLLNFKDVKEKLDTGRELLFKITTMDKVPAETKNRMYIKVRKLFNAQIELVNNVSKSDLNYQVILPNVSYMSKPSCSAEVRELEYKASLRNFIEMRSRAFKLKFGPTLNY